MNIPPSVLAQTADASTLIFYGDDNAWVLHFPTVSADAIRLVVRRGTYGFAPDDLARQQVIKAWGNVNPEAACLREIEAYMAPIK